VLVLDDWLADATPEIARSFGDPRVHHVRHAPISAHAQLQRGHHMAREYVWLIWRTIGCDGVRARAFVTLLDRHRTRLRLLSVMRSATGRRQRRTGSRRRGPLFTSEAFARALARRNSVLPRPPRPLVFYESVRHVPAGFRLPATGTWWRSRCRRSRTSPSRGRWRVHVPNNMTHSFKSGHRPDAG